MIVRSLFQVVEMHVVRLWKWYVMLSSAFLLLIVMVSYLLVYPPNDFPTNKLIEIPEGTSLTTTARILRTHHIISSSLAFRIFVELLPGKHTVISGVYTFTKPLTSLHVAWNITHAITGVPMLKITFPEGTPSKQMGELLAQQLVSFDENEFVTLSKPYEGYLFPDTYFFLPHTTPKDVADTLRTNFAKHTNWKQGLVLTDDEEYSTIILASLLEAEGKTLIDRRIIAGILLARLTLNMPLQVDATFGYALGRVGYVPTRADIESDSPYNSYRKHGLPPTPVNNPGEESLLAARTPTKTNYLYYLTGSDGQMHYASTFAQHIANQKKYFK